MQPAPVTQTVPGWLKSLSKFLNPQRMKYAWLMGGMMWIAWLISIILGNGNYDLAKQPLGGDYVDFHAAGETINQGETDRLYDFDYQRQLQVEILGGEFSNPTAYNALITPPHYSVPFIILAKFPYPVSFALWSLLGLGFVFISINLTGMDNPKQVFVWALTYFPIFAAISFGQNSLLSLVLFSLAYAFWTRQSGSEKQNLLIAGLFASLLLYKPQIVFGIGLLWLFNFKRDWPALVSLGLGGAIQAGLSFWLMPQASLNYFHLAKDVLPSLLQQPGYPIWHSHNLRAFWLLLMPGLPALAEEIATLLSLAGIPVFFKLNQDFQSQPKIRFAAAIILTAWLSPHFLIYDWSILLLPALLLWQALPEQRRLLKTLYALIWIAIFVGGPLTYATTQALPIAIQISVPVFALVCYELLKLTKTLKPTTT